MTDHFSQPTDDETTYAQGRLPGRTYASRTFTVNVRASRDFGEPARFVYKVFDNDEERRAEYDGESWVVGDTEKGRYQFKLLVAREAGRVKDLWIQRVPSPSNSAGKVKPVLHLPRDQAARLIELLRNLDHIPVSGDVAAVRVDDELLRDIFANPDSVATIYREDPSRFRSLISNDESARDVVAVAHRRAQLKEFRRLIEDPGYFDELATGRGPEAVWQKFLEGNPWVLGVSLGGQLLTAFDETRLEQVVVGASIAGPGKRADALLRTAGRIRSIVFAEIKHHRTRLLSKEYRPGCWSASDELVGGVAQAQGTVQRAVASIGTRLAERTGDGSGVPGEFTYLIRPRSYLIVGRLEELIGERGGHHYEMVQSFELFRRHLGAPEIITFDELLARAEWLVEGP